MSEPERLHLEHVALGSVWRLELSQEASICLVLVRYADGEELNAIAGWCLGRPAHLGHLCMCADPSKNNAAATQAIIDEINVKLRDLIGGVVLS